MPIDICLMDIAIEAVTKDRDDYNKDRPRRLQEGP